MLVVFRRFIKLVVVLGEDEDERARYNNRSGPCFSLTLASYKFDIIYLLKFNLQSQHNR